MHYLCGFCTFSAFTQKIFKGWGCNFTWSFSKVMRIKSLKMVYVTSIISHSLIMHVLCIFLICFCSKIIFDQNIFSLCWDKLDYPGSIVYLSCLFELLANLMKYDFIYFFQDPGKTLYFCPTSKVTLLIWIQMLRSLENSAPA